MQNPKISIVLPFWSGERYLNESIDSVLAQEYTDYEFLICDDASPDNSIRIVESKQDARIRFFKNNTNQGMFKTLNMLIRQSRAEFIRLWTHDDIMKPHCLKEEIEFYKNHPEIGFCYCACDIINEKGIVVMNAPEDKSPDIIPPELAAQIMFYHGTIAANFSTAMIKRDVLDYVGLFRGDMRVAGDFEMWVRISKKYPIGFIRQPLIYLRSHRGQFSYRKGMGVVFIREDQEIIPALIERLPPEIIPYAKVYSRWQQYTQYAHSMIRCFLSGDFKTGLNTYREIRKLDNPFLAIGLWLLTMNGRFFKKKPRYTI